MENLAPDIFRQRLLLEGFYTNQIDAESVKHYLLGLADHLDLRAYGDPIIFSPASGMGKEENAGYDAFLPLIDSGISAYIWTKQQFFSIVVYTCKGFCEMSAREYTQTFFSVKTELAHKSF